MGAKKSLISSVPAGSFFAEHQGKKPERKRAVSDEYLKDEAAEKAIENASLDELIVPSGYEADAETAPSTDESDVHDMVIEPSEIPAEPPKQKPFAEGEAEQKPVKRGRFFSSISSALLGVSQKPDASRSEIEQTLREALERANKKP